MTQERVLIDDSIFNLKVVLFNFVADFLFDCEQSIFSSKIHGKERKTSKRASVTVIVTPLTTLSSGNADGDGYAETCEKIGERTPL